ncbi:hypothetical protein DRJ12_02835 [Candidatus Acetothermia bacterium]|nr:MAG: hypothetical protein DRJ12_02835 [Candidatus Acetothermia bacterium]
MFSPAECARILGGRLLRERKARPARVIHDSRLVEPGDLFVALKGARTDGHAFLEEAFTRGASGAIVSRLNAIPKNAYNLIVVDDTLTALQRLAAAWREEVTGTIVGITGTCGKTTTKALLGHLLAGEHEVFVAPHSYNTAIGIPIALLSMPKSAKFGIFELGASAPGEILPLARLLQPDIAIITMVGQGHLAGFGSVEAVAREKWSLIAALPEDGIAIVNLDSAPLAQRASAWEGRIITVGTTEGDIQGRVASAFPGLLLETDRLRLETRLLGEHNVGNILTAVACALQLGISEETIEDRIRMFTPPPHRLNLVSAPFGWILDDSYNANPDSTAAALRTLAEFPGKRKAFVFGEMLELGEDSIRCHREILELALELGISPIYPIGDLPVRTAKEAFHKANEIRIIPREALPVRILADLSGSDAVLLVKGSHALRLDQLVDEIIY